MIVKTTRWKQKNISYLLNYIDNDKGKTKGDKETFSLFHNICHPNLKDAQEAFKINETYRKKRKNGVVIYHEILSFHQKDNKNLDVNVLEDIALKYIEIRGNNALCFAKPHLNDANIHIHFAFSGTEYKCSKTLRMDNKTFKQNRLAIEQYQMEHYPDLSNSIVYHNSKSKQRNKTKDREYQTKKRTRKTTDKETLTDILKEHSNAAKSFDEFCKILNKEGFELYKYRDKINGIYLNKRKYRFKTLGFGADFFMDRKQAVNEFIQLQPEIINKDIRKILHDKDGINEFKQVIENIQKTKKQRSFIDRLKNLQTNIRCKISNGISKLSTRMKSRMLGKNR